MFNIIPQPVTILTNNDKKGFTLHAGTTISPFPFSEDFVRFIRKNFNKKILIHENTFEEKSIILTLDDKIEWEEGYTLKCENRRVFISAKTETGLFYALETLKQMLLQTNGKLPYTEITDYPDHSYRGYKIATDKALCTADEMKKLIELMALHKLNVLNCKLEDYYTTSECEELVTYCRARKIKILTEAPKNVESNEQAHRLDLPYGINTLKNVCNNKIKDGAVGVECFLEGNLVKDYEQLQFFTFPRIAAIAETAWAKDYGSFVTFVHKAQSYYKVLDAYKVNYAPLNKACPSFFYKNTSKLIFKIKKFFDKC